MSRRTTLAALVTAASLAAGTVQTLSAADPAEGVGQREAAISSAAAEEGQAGERAGYTVGLFGDVPYGEEGRAELPALIADMNRERLAFSIHIGDIKSGSERCDDALYTATRATLNGYRRPVVYTPGDNEWTDCHRANNGAYDPLERLAKLRSVFYAERRRSLGQHRLRLRSQSRRFPENARWSRGPVTYATVHVVGSNNNRAAPGDGGRTPEQIAAANAEYEARNRANVAWIEQTFAEARLRGAKGVVIAMQADMNLTGQFPPESSTGFTDTVATLRRETVAFDGEVALLHGDSHVFIHDKPLRAGADNTGGILENFTRVETFGAADTHWVALRINPDGRNLFSVEPRLVPENVEEHAG